MKYFTMEELDYIARELIENPSKETLKKLNDKYNGEEAGTKNLNWVESSPKNNEEPQVENKNENIAPTFSIPSINNQSVASFNVPINNNDYQKDNNVKYEEQVAPKFEEELALKTPVWNPTMNTNNTLYNTSTNSTNNIPNTNNNTNSIGNLNIQEKTPINNNALNFELPRVDNNMNNNKIPFNGNLWGNQNSEINSMMQTTDNFNTPIEQTISNNTNKIEQMPFFQPDLSPINNPIPVSEPQVTGPTMFGQFEQNFNNNNAA